MAEVGTEIAVIVAAVAGLTAAVIAGGYSLGGIKFASRWLWGLFKGTSR